MSVFIKYGDIKGQATLDEVKEWVDCDSLSWGVTRMIDTQVGRAANREVSLANVQEVVVTKDWDYASHQFAKAAAIGSEGEQLEIVVTRAADGGEAWLKITCAKTLVSSYHMSVGNEGKPVENITFNFTELTLENFERKDDGSTGGSEKPIFNVAAGTVG